jgi:hypothetical protein
MSPPMSHPLYNRTQIGSYAPEDVTFLLTPIADPPYVDFSEKERLLASGRAHYSELLSREALPTREALSFFEEETQRTKERVARLTLSLAQEALRLRGDALTLVSIARAGTPVGILTRRALKRLGVEAPHYSISLIRGRGVDASAIRSLLEHYPAERLLFIDGWVSKGGISETLRRDLQTHHAWVNLPINADMWTLSDPLRLGGWTATCEDLLFPHALLNAPVSGLISRTLSPVADQGETSYHRVALLEDDLGHEDRSRYFVDQVSALFPRLCSISSTGRSTDSSTPPLLTTEAPSVRDADAGASTLTSLLMRLKNELGYEHPEALIKLGVGEVCRALLRRSTTRLFVKSLDDPELLPVLDLAQRRGLTAEVYPTDPFLSIALIGD